MNQFLSNKIIAGIVALALLVGVGVLVSSGDTSTTTRNAALVVGTPCTKPGQVTKVSKQSVVCATTDAGSLWYATMKAKGKAQACKSPGAIREKSNIVWVCGVIKKKKLWQATQPLTALPVEGDLPSTTPATPDAPVVADNAVLADPAVIDTAATQTLAPAVPAALSLKTQPSGGVNALALETQPVVQLLDQTGAPVSTAGITITAVTDRANVVLSGNTAVTDATGRATFKTLSLKGIMGEIALTFTAPRVALEGVTSGNLVLAAGVATALVSDTSLGAVAAGKQFNQFFKLHLQDSGGNVVAVSGRDVIVSSSREGLSGTTTVATAIDGYAIFKELMLVQPGKTTLTFTSGLLSTTSIVEVKSSDSQGLKITTEPSESATNDVAFAQAPVVQLIDAEGNNVITEGFAVKAKILGFPAGAKEWNTELANSEATTNKFGVATFTGLRIKGLIGAYTLGFEPAGGVAQPSAKPTKLSAGDAKKLFQQRFTVVEPGSAAGTWSPTQSPVIGLLDTSNNPVTTGGVTVTATVPGEKQTFSAVTDADGVATLSNMTLSGEKSGDRTIKYTAPAVSELSEQINLPPLTPAVQAWVLLTGKTTTSPDFTTTSPEFPLTPPTSNSLGAWTYTSDTPAIAEVTATGALKFKGKAGTVTIRANQAANEKFTIATKNAILNIGLTPSTVGLLDVPFFTNTSSDAFQLKAPTSNRDGAWTYTSDKPTIATVDPSNGTVTPRGVAGTVIITATQAETTKYRGATSTANLVIALTPTVVDRDVLYDFDKNTYSFNPTRRPSSKRAGDWTYTSDSPYVDVNETTGNVISGIRTGTVTITATQAATPMYASATSTYTGTYKSIIGKTGPGGGIVFYVALTSFKCGVDMTADCKYLEAATNYGTAPSTWTPATQAQWGCSSTNVMSLWWQPSVIEIGRGRANTNMINCGASSAGSIAKAYNGGGKTDWFLPSRDELNQLCRYARGLPLWASYDPIDCYGNGGAIVPGFAGHYWSSSEHEGTYGAWDQNFFDGNQYASNKPTTYYVRPVRAFGTVSVATAVIDGFQVGDAGPGGGIVFYAAPTPFKCGVDMTADCKYLEAATANGTTTSTWKPATKAQWGCSSTNVMTLAQRTASLEIGRGRANTNMINCGASSAGSIAKAYNGGGKTDWFLPSRNELDQMYDNRAAIGGFASDGYWSSSESGAGYAWLQYFDGGYQYGYNKTYTVYVRPVRAF